MIKYENNPVGWQGEGLGDENEEVGDGVWCGEILVLKLRRTGGK